MADNYGVSFAPTQENQQQGPLNAQIDGLPAAIKILAMRMPKFFGGGGIVPQQLATAPGAGGMDPIASAVLTSMAKAVGAHSMGLPGGTAGPDPFFRRPMPGGGGMPGGPGRQAPDPQPSLPSGGFGKPHVVFAPGGQPGGFTPPMPGPFGGGRTRQ